MKIFHTADWHLGKLVQGVHMTEDQRIVLEQFVRAIEEEKPDAVIIAGDLYDRAVPPTEAVHLLDETLNKIVLDLETPVLAIAGNHDSPGRLHFASSILKEKQCFIVGQLSDSIESIVLEDDYGEVHFYLIPYADPGTVRNIFQDDTIKTHDDAMKSIIERIQATMDPHARHVFVGHAFVTPYGEEQENTSDSERPLSIGGAEYVSAEHFSAFHYTALGHLHQPRAVSNDRIRYAGSILKYSISEEHHKKGFYIVELDDSGQISIEKRLLIPERDMRSVEGTIEDLLKQPVNDDYVFVTLLDETPVLNPMEKIRSVYPNAMHIERKSFLPKPMSLESSHHVDRTQLSDVELFQAFYKEVTGHPPSEETMALFTEILDDLLAVEREDSEGQLTRS